MANRKETGKTLIKENFIEKFWAIPSAVLLDVVCVLCFLYSVRLIFTDIFRFGLMERDFVLRMLSLTVGLSLLLELASRFNVLLNIIVNIGTMAAGVVWILRYFKVEEQVEELVQGAFYICSQYLEAWNEKYGTTFSVAQDSDFVSAGVTLNFVLMVLFLVIFWIARDFGKTIVLAVIPLVILVLGLLVGKVPRAEGMFLLLAGIFLVNSGGFAMADFAPAQGKKKTPFSFLHIFSWVRTAALTLGLFLLITTTQEAFAEKTVEKYAEPAQKWTEDTAKETVKEVMEAAKEFSDRDLVEAIKNPEQWQEMLRDLVGDIRPDTADLSNSAPEYSNTTEIILYLDKNPSSALYLKNFAAGTYKNGSWKPEKNTFEAAAESAGYSPEVVAEQVLNLTVDKWRKAAEKAGLEEKSLLVGGSVIYAERTDAAQLPYFSQAKQVTLQPVADGWMEKPEDIEKIEFRLWELLSDELWLGMVMKQEKTPLEVWYQDYVEQNYLAVPEQMPQVEALAKELDTPHEHSELDTVLGVQNAMRVEKAQRVVQWMWENTEYSLSLPKLPSGEDAVEYFLGTTKKGYCMHYASASTLLLRSMGVPTRYVSGYIAEADSFVFGRDIGMYKSMVEDNRAHAWVEIYLNGIGWIPVEVTAGYGDTPEPTATPTLAPTGAPTLTPVESPIPTGMSGGAPTPTPALNDEENSSGEEDAPAMPSPTPISPEQEPDNISSDKKRTGKTVGILAGIVAGVAALVAAVSFGLPRIKKALLRKEQEAFEEMEPRKAILHMNHRMYEKLRLAGKLQGMRLRDEEYAEALKKAYPKQEEADWERYMELCRRAAFSKESMRPEEREFCYGLYRMVLWAEKKAMQPMQTEQPEQKEE